MAQKTLRGDVETIVGKAMEKDKDRRHQSASALGADVGRYLSDEPISARPSSTMCQLRKFARRNRALVGGVVAVFVEAVGESHVQTTRVAGYLADLYDEWGEAEPGAGHDVQAAQWRGKLGDPAAN